MREEGSPEPDWDESENWDEFAWERALKHSDDLAGRYFRMLERFGDLPDAEELIAARLGDQGFFEIDDSDFADDWTFEDYEAETDDDDGEEETGVEEGIEPGDALYYENAPVYQRARQIALGWCNILASVLSQDERYWGLKVLFHLGRLLSYLALSIGDGTHSRIRANIAFAKRGLHQINTLLGELDAKSREGPKYSGMFNLVREHLLDTHDLLTTYLMDCHKRAANGSTEE